MNTALINASYVLASMLFIFGLKGLTHPRTAVRGNLLGALGMLLAVIATLLSAQIISFEWILLGLVIGAAVGAVLAIRVQMTDMPQMVALLNGFGGVASVFVAGAALFEELGRPDGLFSAGGAVEQLDLLVLGGGLSVPALVVAEEAASLGAGLVAQYQFTIATVASGLIGSVTLLGSMVAFGKLQGLIKDPPRVPGQQFFNGVLLLVALACGAWLVVDPSATIAYWGIVLVGCVLGVSLVIVIGGADMPVVIALLNSYSGLAAAATGFVLNNTVLIITGSLVGASGLILTTIMCKAMNRSLTNVLFGVWVPSDSGPSADEVYAGKVKSSSPEELAMLLDGAGRVVFVPGFGMAVAQAQHAVRELTNLLEARGATVEFAIHPVAGRMPGHMNVLLAEADIPYDKLKEMDEINPSFGEVDVAIVIGANDVVNPVARTDPNSPIAGMPIINVDQARSVVVVKRSLSPGFAGIPNPLFAAENTVMLFSDAKKGMVELANAMKE